MSAGAHIGSHLITDFAGALYQTNAEKIEFALRSAAEHAGATVLDVIVHTFPHSDGITGVALLAESHISIHSWPEHDYMAFDIFMCGKADSQQALKWLEAFFKPCKVATHSFERASPR